MPKLSDYVQKLNDTTESTESTDDGLVSGLAQRITNRLFGLNGVERYQLWPERVIRSGATVAGDVMSGKEPLRTVDPITGELTLSPQLIGRNLDAAALMGTGGLAGTGAAAGEKALTSQMLKPQEVTLGAGPFLRPALKFKDRIYKAPPNGQHLDALPPEMAYEFQRAAMRGDDISNYNFGFMNHKGQFLSREAALDYAIKEGLLHPNSEAARAGTLTSTMDLMADSSKPGTAVASNKPARNQWTGQFRKEGETPLPGNPYRAVNTQAKPVAKNSADVVSKMQTPDAPDASFLQQNLSKLGNSFDDMIARSLENMK